MTDAELDLCRHDGALLRSIVADQVKLTREGREWKGLCPFHNETISSFTVYDDGHFHCYGCGAHGTVFDYVMKRDGVEFPEAAKRVAAGIGAAPARPTAGNGVNGNGKHKGALWQPILPTPADAPLPTADQLRCDTLHEYRDANDRVLCYVRRVEAKSDKAKQFYPLTFGVLDGKVGWHTKAPDKPKPLYGLNRLHAAPDAVILLCEGEKSADAAQRLFPDMIAMSWMGGVNGDGGADLVLLDGRNVIIWGDADEVGGKAVARLAKRLPDAHWVDTAGLPDGYDAADLEADGCADPDTWLLARERTTEQPDDREEQLSDAEPDDEKSPTEWNQDIGPNGEIPTPGEDAGAEASEAEAEAQIDAVPPGDVLNAIAELGPGLTRKMLVAVFNKRFSVAYEGGKTAVIWSTFDALLQRDHIERASFDDFRKLFSNRRLTVTIPGGKPPSVTKSFGEWWLGDPGRRQYLGGVTFAPGAGPIPHTFNLWRGWAVDAAPGDWSLMSDHIHTIICGGRSEVSSYVIRWLARMVQYPAEPGEVAIVVRGLKGVGKTIVGKWLLRLCGQHGLHIHNPIHLTGRFTGHLRDVIFVLADEAFFAGDREHERILKGIITDDQLLIEPKYRTAAPAANMLHLMMFSNEDWVIPASLDERRYVMMQAAADRIGDFAYFAALDAQMANGGLAAMLHDLQNMDIRDFHPRRSAPDTEELAEQKMHSMDTVHRWLAAVLARGFVWKSRYGHREFLQWDEFVTTELLSRSYAQWCQENRITYPAHRELLGKKLAAIYPPGRPRVPHPVYEADSLDRDDKQPVVKLGNQYGYKVGTLDNARALFSKAIGRAADTSEWDTPLSC